MIMEIETQGGTKLKFHDISTEDKTVDLHLKDGDLERSYQIDKTELVRVLLAITYKYDA